MTLNDFLPHIDRIPAVDTFISAFMPLAQLVYGVGVGVAFAIVSIRQHRLHGIITAQVRQQARESGCEWADELAPPLRYHLFSAYMCAVLAMSWPLVMILKPEELERV